MNDKARVLRLNETMGRWAAMLSGQVGAPVQDGTGLTGNYDLEIYWSNGNSALRATPPGEVAPPPGPTIFEALRDQLGLALTKKKGPVKMLVVDHFNHLPTEN